MNFNQLDWLVNETNFKGLAHLFLILYAARLAPELPKQVLDLFTNGYFKLFIFMLILYTANVNPTTALLIAIAFMVTLNVVNQKKMFEMMEDTTEAPAATEAPVTAVQVLAEAAATPTAAPVAQIIEVAQVAQSAVQTQAGAEAVQALAEAAIATTAAPIEQVNQMAQVAVDSMTTQVVATSMPMETPAPAVEDPMTIEYAAPIATIAPVTPEPAMTPEAQMKQVAEKVEAELPCYPERKYDMEKVQPVAAFDNYSEFLLSA